MKIEGAILVDNPHDAGPAAKNLEEIGYDGAFNFEGRHDPFLQIAVAAEHTERIELVTAIAVAFARNPMNLANIGYDLQLQSKGRFVLGLGSQIRPHIQKRYSMPWSKPAARMREMVLALRAIWACWQEGEKLDFRGEFYTHTIMTPVFNPGPNPHGTPKVFLAGVGPRMTEVTGEVADGFFLHPFHTMDFVNQTTLPSLEKGLATSGRSRGDFEISVQCIIVSGTDEESFEAAKNGAKAQLSFYGSTPAYSGVLESIGYGELHKELHTLSKQGRWLEMAGLIDDDVIGKIAVVGERDEIADKLRARYGGIADRISLVAPFAPDSEHWASVVRSFKEA
ncbi:MAG: LLM class F420-dependent oxidoreductase [Deltaproteobacteria bacterium]|nr:LLM class F420-dependent oxidoreductase [Deltaproteobacteria bacterium]